MQYSGFSGFGAGKVSWKADGQRIVFERAVYPFDTPSSLWIVNRDGSGLHKLIEDAGRPAWGRVPAPLDKRVNLPLAVK